MKKLSSIKTFDAKKCYRSTLFAMKCHDSSFFSDFNDHLSGLAHHVPWKAHHQSRHIWFWPTRLWSDRFHFGQSHPLFVKTAHLSTKGLVDNGITHVDGIRYSSLQSSLVRALSSWKKHQCFITSWDPEGDCEEQAISVLLDLIVDM